MPTDPFVCPRNSSIEPHESHWINGYCSYCGSLNATDFMGGIQNQTLTLNPTDKNYKVYVKGEKIDGKLYFQHLDGNQQQVFVQCLNSKILQFHPGIEGFSVLPFFIKKANFQIEGGVQVDY